MRATALARSALAAAAALSLAACDGDGGGPTTAKLLPAFIAVSGESMAAVDGARVSVGGAEYFSDRFGRVFPAGVPAPGDPIEIRAAGFLERRTSYHRRDESDRMTLWPIAGPSGITEQFIRETVYTSSTSGVVNPPPGAEPMRRWAPGLTNIRVVLLGPDDNPEYQEFSASALDNQRRAIADMNAALNGQIAYGQPEPGDDVGATGTVRIRIWPGLANCATAAATALVNARTVTNPIVNYCSPTFSAATALHELGHTFGLRHSTDPFDIMDGSGRRRTQVMSAREKVVIPLMLQRSAGNRFPDDDRTAQVAAASVSPPVEFLCH
jgi:hypothetical protein